MKSKTSIVIYSIASVFFAIAAALAFVNRGIVMGAAYMTVSILFLIIALNGKKANK